jgi:hypothetical protein
MAVISIITAPRRRRRTVYRDGPDHPRQLLAAETNPIRESPFRQAVYPRIISALIKVRPASES